MEYLYVKSLHLIFIVTWFAGLFYIVRLFVYHIEADTKPEPEKSILQNQYKTMEKRLWYGITWPSLVLTLIFGGWLLYLKPFLLSEGYFILKLCFVSGLILYHMQCHVIVKNLKRDIVKGTSFKMRLFNEIPTVILFAVVFLIVLKSNTGWVWGMLGLIILSATLMMATKIYKQSRQKKEENVEKKNPEKLIK